MSRLKKIPVLFFHIYLLLLLYFTNSVYEINKRRKMKVSVGIVQYRSFLWRYIQSYPVVFGNDAVFNLNNQL